MVWTYIIIAILLIAAELAYFRIADKCYIIDKPNECSPTAPSSYVEAASSSPSP